MVGHLSEGAIAVRRQPGTGPMALAARAWSGAEQTGEGADGRASGRILRGLGGSLPGSLVNTLSARHPGSAYKLTFLLLPTKTRQTCSYLPSAASLSFLSHHLQTFLELFVFFTSSTLDSD